MQGQDAPATHGRDAHATSDKYARLHPHPKAVRMAFVDSKTPADWHAVLEKYYGE